MAKPINITIKGTDSHGVDAPTAEDLLSQIQDFVGVLRGIANAVADGGDEEIEWRITDASKKSPLTFELTPCPKNYAMNIDQRAARVIGAAAAGLDAMTHGADRPAYFSDDIIAKAKRLFRRVANGLAETIVDISGYDNAPNIEVTRDRANRAEKFLGESGTPAQRAYRELGSIEGYITKLELDRFNRPIIWLRSRLDGQSVKCIAKGKALDRIGHYEVGEVLRSLRVQMFGMIHYKDIEKIGGIEVDGLHVFENDKELPDIEDIVVPNFTNGVEAGEYLKGIREDG